MKGLLFAIGLLACVGTSAAVKCYVCSTEVDLSCTKWGYQPQDNHLVDCGSSFDGCSKTESDRAGIVSVQRSCALGCNPEYVGTTQIKCCTGDGCNGAASIQISLVAGTAMLIASLVLKM